MNSHNQPHESERVMSSLFLGGVGGSSWFSGREVLRCTLPPASTHALVHEYEQAGARPSSGGESRAKLALEERVAGSRIVGTRGQLAESTDRRARTRTRAPSLPGACLAPRAPHAAAAAAASTGSARTSGAGQRHEVRSLIICARARLLCCLRRGARISNVRTRRFCYAHAAPATASSSLASSPARRSRRGSP